jgi:processive 1,2-diacylglycerol beta-glucosyltransferase
MPSILILTAAYGEGHNAAARGLQAAFTELAVDAEIIDVFALTGGAFYERTRRGYLEVINRAPRIWAGAYWVIDHLPVMSFSGPLLGRMRRALAKLLEEKRPTAVVSVYPAYGYLIEAIYRGRARPFAFHTVVTDSITINRVWHRCASDTFLVPNEQSAEVMAAAGVPRGKLHVFGFPVAPRFAEARPVRRPPADDSPARVLFMVNPGKRGISELVSRIVAMPHLHLTVTVGRDDALRAQIVEAAHGRPIEIHGWTNQMPELLMTHHLLIGKAGGAAVQETIAACTPMLMTSVVPGQEEGNARLLIENGCGALCPTPESVCKRLESLFADQAREWREWEKAIARLSRPGAALEIARFICAK